MRLRIRTAILTAAATLLAAPCTIASASDSTALSEAKAVELAVHGQFRGRYELDTEDGNNCLLGSAPCVGTGENVDELF